MFYLGSFNTQHHHRGGEVTSGAPCRQGRHQAWRSHLLGSCRDSSKLQPGLQWPGMQAELHCGPKPWLWQLVPYSITLLRQCAPMPSVWPPPQALAKVTIIVALPQLKQLEKVHLQLGCDGKAEGRGAQPPLLHPAGFQEHQGLPSLRKQGEQESGQIFPSLLEDHPQGACYQVQNLFPHPSRLGRLLPR